MRKEALGDNGRKSFHSASFDVNKPKKSLSVKRFQYTLYKCFDLFGISEQNLKLVNFKQTFCFCCCPDFQSLLVISGLKK
jgi:hypothetical protein